MAAIGIHDEQDNRSFDTDVTDLAPAINAAIESLGVNEQAVVKVTPPEPEPGSLALVGIGWAA